MIPFLFLEVPYRGHVFKIRIPPPAIAIELREDWKEELEKIKNEENFGCH